MTRLENGPIEPMGELLGARGGRLGPHIPLRGRPDDAPHSVRAL